MKPVTKEVCDVCGSDFEVDMYRLGDNSWARSISALRFQYGTEEPVSYASVCVPCGLKVLEAMIETSKTLVK